MKPSCKEFSLTLDPYFHQLQRKAAWRWLGCVVEASGQTIASEGPPCFVGECCEIIDASGTTHFGEVIGFRGTHVLTMPLNSSHGIRYGDRVIGCGDVSKIGVSDALLGRVIDGMGNPLDGLPAAKTQTYHSMNGELPKAMDRVRILQPLATGVRVLDAMATVGRGQRVGIFGGSGVGKSTLIGMMTRNTQADLTVVGLVGERGREVREFLEESLGEEGRQKSVTVVSTSDESPLMRMRAALAATTLAESYAAQGKHVLLVLDSLTRYAMAAREVGLAAGEPPTSKGYTPSVFARLAKLLERAGNFENGSVTGFYTVLMEGDDQQDPLVDAVRSILDGHIVLSRELASEGFYPPVNVLDSLSRLMPAVTSEEHQAASRGVRRLLAAYTRSADMLRIGLYKAGADAEMDAAIRLYPMLRSLFRQTAQESAAFDATVSSLTGLNFQI